jgi:hypothetical protein
VNSSRSFGSEPRRIPSFALHFVEVQKSVRGKCRERKGTDRFLVRENPSTVIGAPAKTAARHCSRRPNANLFESIFGATVVE